MEGFFPENFLGENFWDEQILPSAGERTSIPDIDFPTGVESEQGSFDIGSSSSQSLIEEALPPQTQSAFIRYSSIPRTRFWHETSRNVSNSQNLNKRLIGLLRRSFPLERGNAEERGFRHMMNERMRRKRQRQFCLDLHSMLPHGTKTDNNSVISIAKREIEQLRRCREELQRENFELEGTLQALMDKRIVGGTKIQFPISITTSGIDSMIEILKWLKSLQVNTIRINFSHEGLFAVLETETEITYGEIRRAIERKLNEAKWKLQSQFLLKKLSSTHKWLQNTAKFIVTQS